MVSKFKKKKSKLLKSIVKFILGVSLIALVFTKIDLSEVVSLIATANINLLLLALIFIFSAQCLGGLRMVYYLKKFGMGFSYFYGVCFYFLGAMLNTVVPGGIGGDGYKAYYFQKKYRFPWTKTIITVLRGRASGLFFLILSLIVISLLYIEKININNIEIILFASLIALFPIYVYIAKKFLREDIKTLVGAFAYSIPVQILYLSANVSILLSLGDIEDILGYLLVFQIANIVAIIPISIGGIGIREYTFMIVAGAIGLDLGIGIAASLVFYGIYTLTSLTGMFPYFLLNKLDEIQKKEMSRFNANNLF